MIELIRAYFGYFPVQFYMTDEKGSDEKTLCVPVSDSIWNQKNDIGDF